MNFAADAVERFDIVERERADHEFELVGREIDVFDGAPMILDAGCVGGCGSPFEHFLG
jgi:hypothetical protein